MTATRTPTPARKSWLNRLAGVFGRNTDRSPPAPRPRLSVEGLEDRMCPTGINLQTALAVENYYGVGTAVAVLHNQLTTDAKQLGYEAVIAELTKATPEGSAILQDALQLYIDAYYGANGSASNSDKIFADTAWLTSFMVQEHIAAGGQSLIASDSTVLDETAGVWTDLLTDAAFIRANNSFPGNSNGFTFQNLLGFVPISTGTTAFGNLTVSSSDASLVDWIESHEMTPTNTGTGTGGDLLNVMDDINDSLAMGTQSAGGTGLSPSALLGFGGPYVGDYV